MGFFKELKEVVGVIFVAILAIWLVIAGLALSILWPSCHSYSNMTGKEVRWSLFSGCYVVLDSGAVVSREVAEKILSNEHKVELTPGP